MVESIYVYVEDRDIGIMGERDKGIADNRIYN